MSVFFRRQDDYRSIAVFLRPTFFCILFTIYLISLSAQRHPQIKKSPSSVLLKNPKGQSYEDGKTAFLRGNYELASQIIEENRYTDQALSDSLYPNWLLKALLAAENFERLGYYINLYQKQPQRFKSAYPSELLYIIGRYYFETGRFSKARKVFTRYIIEYINKPYTPNCYYWIGESLESEGFLKEAQAVYLVLTTYFPDHESAQLASRQIKVTELKIVREQTQNLLFSKTINQP